MVLGDHTEIWDEIKEQIELISGNKVIKYSRDFMKIKFESNDDLPISKKNKYSCVCNNDKRCF